LKAYHENRKGLFCEQLQNSPDRTPGHSGESKIPLTHEHEHDAHTDTESERRDGTREQKPQRGQPVVE
jgi:hypothetical protein